MSGSSDQLAVMRPAYMSLPSPNITCPEEDQGNPLEVLTEKYKESKDSDDFLFRVNRAGWPGTPAESAWCWWCRICCVRTVLTLILARRDSMHRKERRK